MTEIGHNKQLAALVERIELAEAHKAEIAEDIREMYVEAKSNGFDPKILRKLIRERKRSADERAAEEAMLETYRKALGQLADSPLGRAALERAKA